MRVPTDKTTGRQQEAEKANKTKTEIKRERKAETETVRREARTGVMPKRQFEEEEAREREVRKGAIAETNLRTGGEAKIATAATAGIVVEALAENDIGIEGSTGAETAAEAGPVETGATDLLTSKTFPPRKEE